MTDKTLALASALLVVTVAFATVGCDSDISAADATGSGTADDPFTSFNGTPVEIRNRYVLVGSEVTINGGNPNQGYITGAGNVAEFGLALDSGTISGTISAPGDIVFPIQFIDGSGGNVTVHAMPSSSPPAAPKVYGAGTQQNPLYYVLEVGKEYDFDLRVAGPFSSVGAWGEGTQTLGGTLRVGTDQGGFFSSFEQGETHYMGQAPYLRLTGAADAPFEAHVRSFVPSNDVFMIITTYTPVFHLSQPPDQTMVAGSILDVALSPSLDGCTYTAGGLEGYGTVAFEGNTAHISVGEPGNHTVTVTAHKDGYAPASVEFALHVTSALSPTNSPVNGVIVFVI